MICPKCDEGTLNKVCFKTSNDIGFLCDFCGTYWLEGEEMNEHSGHIFEPMIKDEEIEYTFVDRDGKNGKSKSIMYSKFK